MNLTLGELYWPTRDSQGDANMYVNKVLGGLYSHTTVLTSSIVSIECLILRRAIQAATAYTNEIINRIITGIV